MKRGFFVFACMALLGAPHVAAAQDFDFLAPESADSRAPLRGGAASQPQTFDEAMVAFSVGDNQLAGRKFWQLAQQGDPRAQYYLAYLMDTGQGQSKDAVSALAWYRRAADQDYLPAIVYMGYAASSGHGMTRNDKEAFKWYTRGAQMGDPVAQNNIATMLLSGQPYRRDPELAAQWFLQSALQGNVRAQYNLATLYRTGDGAPQNLAEAFRWYSYAANQGDMYAQSALAWMYRRGEGVARDDAAALEWYRRAAEQGYGPAQYTLARMYERGIGDATKGPEDAAIWYTHAAKGGDMRAQYRLATVYETGKGLPKDMKEAVKWYELASDQDYVPAMLALGRILEKGVPGMAANPRTALKWFRKAADTGDGGALMEMGRVMRDGIGGTQDLAEAYKSFELAASALEGEARNAAVKARISVSAMLSPSDQERARTLLGRWRAQRARDEARKGVEDRRTSANSGAPFAYQTP